MGGTTRCRVLLLTGSSLVEGALSRNWRIAFEAVQKFDTNFMLGHSISGLSPEERTAAHHKDILALVNDLIEWTNANGPSSRATTKWPNRCLHTLSR
jgi:hypothetical protein